MPQLLAFVGQAGGVSPLELRTVDGEHAATGLGVAEVVVDAVFVVIVAITVIDVVEAVAAWNVRLKF